MKTNKLMKYVLIAAVTLGTGSFVTGNLVNSSVSANAATKKAKKTNTKHKTRHWVTNINGEPHDDLYMIWYNDTHQNG